jgi:hypothetical protein
VLYACNADLTQTYRSVACKGVHTLFTIKRWRERQKERKREGGRERGRERKRERERERERRNDGYLGTI